MRWYASLGVLLLVLAAPGRGAAETDRVTHELAKKHFELGANYYKIADYRQALDEFEKAYQLEPLPGLLHNIGRCQELLGELEKAIASYKLYQERRTDTSERGVMEMRIRNLEARLARTRAATPTTTPAVTTPPARTAGDEPAFRRAPAAARPASWRRDVGWSAIGVGGAALVTGIVLGALVRSKTDEYDRGVAAGRTFTALDQIASTGKRYQAGELAALIVGGTLLAGGGALVLWYYLSGKEPTRREAALLPFAGPGGAGVVGRF